MDGVEHVELRRSAGPGDRHEGRLLGEHPRHRGLRRSKTDLGRERTELLHERVVLEVRDGADRVLDRHVRIEPRRAR
jgi:hypothetical protein